MAKAAPYEPPPDPDFSALAQAGYEQWKRDHPKTIAFDTETHGTGFHDGAFCATLAWESAGKIVGHYFEIDRHPPSLEMLTHIFRETQILVGHNLKFDLQKGVLGGWIHPSVYNGNPHLLHDTEALAHLDDEHRPKRLKELMVSVLGWEDVVEVEIKSGPNKGQFRKVPREKHELDTVRRKLKMTKEDPWSLLPRAIIMPYAVKDAQGTLGLYKYLRPRVEQFDDLWGLYAQEQELMVVLSGMEAAGLRLNREYVDEQVRVLGHKVLEHEQRIEQIVGKPVRTGKMTDKEKPLFFNPNSNPQIKEYFSALGYDRESYDADTLKTFDHPLAPALIALRKDSKILDTYFRAMKREQRNGILNTNFRQHGTVTGRMSSGKQEG